MLLCVCGSAERRMLRHAWVTLRCAPRVDVLRRLLFTENGVWGELTNEERRAAERAWLQRVSTPPPARPGQHKAYVLAMFPYPSGRLHMGHVRVYAISDAVARFHRLLGKQVIHPMGWDAFGLPAENAALDRQLAPADWTRDNIEHMRGQLDRTACCFDWERELATCRPDYYRWTQWLFLQLHRAGLVYRRQALVNWDPVDGTVLADEQVDEQGRSWRSGAPVERRHLRQWFVRTTRFSERLARGLQSDQLRDWRDIVQLQRHWIGDCDGWKFELQVENTADPGARPDPLLLWTADPLHFWRASFVGLRPEHALAQGGAAPLAAVNPATGGRLPLLVSDRLPFPDGADAVLCSAEDGPEAARLAAALPPPPPPAGPPPSPEQVVAAGGGYRCSSRLHDWLISRQRYWGTPIPAVHCPACGAVPLPEEQLPVRLPRLAGLRRGRSPLLDAADWLDVDCPSCGGPARRETDTMDTFVDSSWYYLRYLDPHNAREPFDPQKVNALMPVDIYVGGKEHAVLHLYYARFIHHFLHSLGLVSCEEPFSRLLVQGQVMGQSYRISETGQYLRPDQVQISEDGSATSSTGQPVTVQWEKMSKSKLNGVDPDDVLDELGADTTRLLMLANVAPTSSRHWSRDSFPPLLQWQRRLWLTVGDFLRQRSSAAAARPPAADELARLEAQVKEERNYFVRTVTLNFQETHQLSVAISRLQGLTTALRRVPAWYQAVGAEYERALGDLIIMTSPVMPCLASEMWAAYSSVRHTHPGYLQGRPVLEQRWPAVDQDATLELVIEINGQESASVPLARHRLDLLTQADAWRLAQLTPEVARYTAAGVSACRLELLPGLGATLHLQALQTPADPADAQRQEVLRQREQRKLLKKQKKELRRQKRAQRGADGQ